jgi:hypothetical protein
MRIMRVTWIGLGAGVGYVLGARAGRERYDQIVDLTRRTAADFGLLPAVDQVVDSTKSSVGDVHDAFAERSSGLLQTGADQVSDAVTHAGDAVSERIADQPS